MIYHKYPKRWDDKTVDIVGRGQELALNPKELMIVKNAYTIDQVEYFKKLKN